MKKYFFVPAIVLFTICVSLSSFKCVKQTNCDGVICTMIFAAVTVHVNDLSASAIPLTVYTVRDLTGEKITLTQSAADAGNYVVLDDSYHLKIAGKTEPFTFIGMKGTTQVFKEKYQIKADCCHVSKVSGKDSLTIP